MAGIAFQHLERRRFRFSSSYSQWRSPPNKKALAGCTAERGASAVLSGSLLMLHDPFNGMAIVFEQFVADCHQPDFPFAGMVSGGKSINCTVPVIPALAEVMPGQKDLVSELQNAFQAFPSWSFQEACSLLLSLSSSFPRFRVLLFFGACPFRHVHKSL